MPKLQDGQFQYSVESGVRDNSVIWFVAQQVSYQECEWQEIAINFLILFMVLSGYLLLEGHQQN
jgi:hypothetical protein